MSSRFWFHTVVAAQVLLCLVGCSREANKAQVEVSSNQIQDLARQGKATLDVAYRDGTVVLDREKFRRGLRGIDRRDSLLIFDDSIVELKNLAPGKVFLVPNVAVLKIVQVAHFNSQLVVQTTAPALTDFIREGTLCWDTPIKFATMGRFGGETGLPRSSNAWPLGRLWLDWDQPVLAYSALSGNIDGWDYSMDASPAPDRLNLNFKLSKSIASSNAKLAITATGYVQNFETVATIEIHDSALKYFDYRNSNLNGLVNFAWSASKQSAGTLTTEERLKLPKGYVIPFVLGGIPFTLEITGALLFKPGFTGNGEMAGGNFRVEYNGVQGFSLRDGNISEDGATHGNFAILPAPNMSVLGPMGFVTGLAFPRVELKLAGLDSLGEFLPEGASQALDVIGEKAQAVAAAVGVKLPQTLTNPLKSDAAAYVEVVTVTSLVQAGTLTSIGVPCQEVNLIVTGKVGAHATLLAQSMGDFEKEIFKHGEKQKTGTCPRD
jgi:hypothetical protein